MSRGQRVGNAILSVFIRAGMVPSTYLLTTRGRKTGQPRTNPVTLVVQDDGRRWLVAPYGPVSWVHNARAAGRVTLRRRRRDTRDYAIREVGPEEAGPILKRYVGIATATRSYFHAGKDSPAEDFVAEAVHHPVFELIPIGEDRRGGSPTEANRRIIRQAFEAWRQGTGAIADVFAPEMVWRIEGHSLASKEYESKQQFIDEVLAPFGARFSSSAPFRPITIRSIHADGDSVIVLWDGRGIANDGQPYENSYAWFMKMRDGKVIDGTAFYDSISFNDLWTRVQPRR